MSDDQGGRPQNPGQQPPAYPGAPVPPYLPPPPGSAPAPGSPPAPQQPAPPAPAYPGAPPQPTPPQPVQPYPGGAPVYPGAPPQPVAPQPAPPYPGAAPAYPGATAQGYPGSAAQGYPGSAAPGYVQPYGQPYAAPLRSNGLAVASLILGIAGLLFFWLAWLVLPFLSSLAAVVTGHVALGRVKRDATLGGRGLAVTGLVLGYVGAAINLILGAIVILGFVLAASSGNSF